MNIGKYMKRKKYLYLPILIILSLFFAYLIFSQFKPFMLFRNEKLVYEHDGSIYLNNGFGLSEKTILQNTKGQSNQGDLYILPSLAPDNKKLVCLKQIHKEKSTDFQAMVVDTDTLAEKVLFGGPLQEPFTSSLVWAKDGNGIYYLVGDQIKFFDFEKNDSENIVDCPMILSQSVWPSQSCYIRLSKNNPNLIYALVPKNISKEEQLNIHVDPRKNIILEINIVTKKINILWVGKGPFVLEVPGDPGSFGDIAQKINKDAFESLFGSLRYPVVLPVFTSDGRYYYFDFKRFGSFAKFWLEIHDPVSNFSWDVKVFGRSLYTE